MPSSSLFNRRPLVPSTSNSLNAASHRLQNSSKRKSDDVETQKDDSHMFTARFLSSKDQSLIFSSVTLLARACLPLAWLDTSRSSPSPVFEAKILSVQEWEQRVLVARMVPNGGLHAIEKVGADVYVAFALHPWVSEASCKDAALGKVGETRLGDLLKKDDGLPLGHIRTTSSASSAAISTPTSPKKPTNRRGRLARMSILASTDFNTQERVSGMSDSPSTLEHTIVAAMTEQVPLAAATPMEYPDPLGQTLPSPSVQQDFEHFHELQNEPVAEITSNPERLRSQYLEHLYTSKTSLAFYVKGPLSRARAQVRSTDCPSTLISELLEFYDQSILPPKKIDLKYKESLSKIITELPMEAKNTPPKKNRKKKSKLGKDCLWPEEEGYITRWWHGRDLIPDLASSVQKEELRKDLADLRMRETKMQMLLILEHMLLELAAARLPEKQVPVDPKVKVESMEDGDAAISVKATPKTKGKKRNLPSELDTIVDRLCIWHTVAFDETTDAKSQSDMISKSHDSLRDFCKDVLLPFYSVKLPDQVKLISRKLGGPDISPKRPRPPPRHSSVDKASSASTMLKPKPGQTLAKRTLERVLSEDHIRRHASPPLLSRSSTTPMNAIVPTLKREPSERPLSRGGMLSKSMSFGNREIDLVADSRAHQAKRRKLDKVAQQKRELEEAIEALKRPSRTTVAGAFMDEVENRRQEKAVQISATPRARRLREQTEWSEPELPPILRSVQVQEMSVIPSSTRKPQNRASIPSSSSVPRSSAIKRAVLTAIHETPSRGLERKKSNPLALAHPQGSPPSATNTNVFTIAATPASKGLHSAMLAHADTDSDLVLHGPDLGFSSSQLQSESGTAERDRLRMSRSQRPVLFTPMKRSDVCIERAFRDAPEIPERAGKMMDRAMGGKGRALEGGFEDQNESVSSKGALGPDTRSNVSLGDADEGDIYDQLGWNDHVDF